MSSKKATTMNRRELLLRTVPACAIGCAGLGCLEELSALSDSTCPQEVHKFDVPETMELSSRRQRTMRWANAMALMASFREDLGEEETIRLLKLFSERRGRQVAEVLANQRGARDFQSFVAGMRPPNLTDAITQEVVEDSERVFSLRVTECVWAEIFQRAGMGGEIGHAAVCYRDYHEATFFNPNIRLERTRTLMQGHDHCNHRYTDVS